MKRLFRNLPTGFLWTLSELRRLSLLSYGLSLKPAFGTELIFIRAGDHDVAQGLYLGVVTLGRLRQALHYARPASEAHDRDCNPRRFVSQLHGAL